MNGFDGKDRARIGVLGWKKSCFNLNLMQSKEMGDKITARNEYEHERKVMEGIQV